MPSPEASLRNLEKARDTQFSCYLSTFHETPSGLEDHVSNGISASVLPLNTSEGRWNLLYRTAAISALITVALFLFQIAAFFVWPPPSTVAGHFALLQSRPFIGLVSLDFLIIVDEVLAIPLCLALYLTLRRVHESLMLIATALTAASITCFLVATPALNMLALSRHYVAARTSAEREQLLAAGQAVPFIVGRNSLSGG